MHSDSFHSSVRKALLLKLKVPIRALHAILRFPENQNHNSWQYFSTQKNAESSSPSTPKEKPDRKHNTTLQHTHTKALVCHLRKAETLIRIILHTSKISSPLHRKSRTQNSMHVSFYTRSSSNIVQKQQQKPKKLQ